MGNAKRSWQLDKRNLQRIPAEVLRETRTDSLGLFKLLNLGDNKIARRIFVSQDLTAAGLSGEKALKSRSHAHVCLAELRNSATPTRRPLLCRRRCICII